MPAFWNELHYVLPDERDDYADVCQRLARSPSLTVFQPLSWFAPNTPWMLRDSLLSCFVPEGPHEQVFIMPISPSAIHFISPLVRMLTDFYLDDEEPQLPGGPRPLHEVSFNEAILLRHPGIAQAFPSQELAGVNVVYISATLEGIARPVHYFLLCEEPAKAWELLARSPENHVHVLMDDEWVHSKPLAMSPLFRAIADRWPDGFLPDWICSRDDVASLTRDGCPREDVPALAHALRRTDSIVFDRNEYFGYFLPDTPFTAQMEKSLREMEENRVRRAGLTARLNAWVAGEAPIPDAEALRELDDLICWDLHRHDFPMDFPTQVEVPAYIEQDDRPTPLLRVISELFICRAARYVLTDSAASRQQDLELRHSLNSIFWHFATRSFNSHLYSRAYIFVNADRQLLAFANLLLPALRPLGEYNKFRYLLSAENNNTMETGLMEAAYLAGDVGLARWIFDNNFEGRVHTSLFECLFRNDKAWAAQAAARLSPGCISWIITETCQWHKTRSGERLHISDEVRLIFRSISRSTAQAVPRCFSRRQRPLCIPVWEEMMRANFPDEA